MNPHDIFSGYGVYEAVGDAGPCQPGYMETWPGSGMCIPTISTPQSACGPGSMEPWPGAGFCVPAAGGAPTQTSSGGGAPIVPGPCPPGTFGVPPYCFPIGTIPGPAPQAPPAPQPAPGGGFVLPGPCPAGTMGVPPACFPVGGGGGVTWGPPPGPQPGPGPQPPRLTDQKADALPSWVLPLGLGTAALLLVVVLAGKKRATPNGSKSSRNAKRRSGISYSYLPQGFGKPGRP